MTENSSSTSDCVEFDSAGTPDRVEARRSVWIAVGAALTVWLCTGIYVVSSDEIAVVAYFGQAQRTVDGAILTQDAGVHFSAPWPIAKVTRVRLFEPRSLTVGSDQNLDSKDFLQSFSNSNDAKFVSGDKNILHLEFTVHYRVSRSQIGDWLYGSASPENRLRNALESIIADIILRSGVDFVHTLGHAQIRQAALVAMQHHTRVFELGVEIDDISIAAVNPPARVKAEFNDVMSARADRETYVQRARAYAEQQQAAADAAARKFLDEAKSFRQAKIENAKAEADRFENMLSQLRQSTTSQLSYIQIRQLAVERRYIEMLTNVYTKVAEKVFLDSGERFDITIQRRP